MRTHKHLSVEELKRLWSMYNQGFNSVRVSRDLNISNATVRNWVREIQHCLAGGRVVRSRGGETLREFVRWLRSEEVEDAPLRVPSVSFKSSVLPESRGESVESRVNRLFDELKVAISDLAMKIVETKNKELVESANQSNLVGFINNRFKS